MCFAPSVCSKHLTGVGHQEAPARVCVLTGDKHGVLHQLPFDSLPIHSRGHNAELVDVLRVHEYQYVQHLQDTAKAATVSEEGLVRFDTDTVMSAQSWAAALAQSPFLSWLRPELCARR